MFVDVSIQAQNVNDLQNKNEQYHGDCYFLHTSDESRDNNLMNNQGAGKLSWGKCVWISITVTKTDVRNQNGNKRKRLPVIFMD